MFKNKKVKVENTITNIVTVQQNNVSSQSPILQTIDIWSYRIIGLGFPFLTIGIISGAVWANEAWGSIGVGIQKKHGH